jgi:hypothetical protein
MVDGYYESSKDVDFIQDNLWTMEQEFRFWMQNRTVVLGKEGIFMPWQEMLSIEKILDQKLLRK